MIHIKKNKGITLISMILTVIVLLIIVGTISYSSINSLQKKKLDNFLSDIDALNDAISVYYVKNGTLPVYYSKYEIDGSEKGKYSEIKIPNTYLNLPENTNEDMSAYCLVDITKLSDITLNNKNNIPDGIDKDFFKNTTNDKKKLEKSIQDGVFVINYYSHIVYYTKSVTVEGKTYYTQNSSLSKIPVFKTKEEVEVEDEIISLAQGANNNKIDDNYVKISFDSGDGILNSLAESIVSEKTNKMVVALNNTLGSESGYFNTMIPSKRGYTFLGWGVNTTDTSPKYEYKEENGQWKYVDKNSSNNNISVDFQNKNEIKLFAVYKENDALLCYYMAGTRWYKAFYY